MLVFKGMVTIDQGDGQFQGTGGATQTQNPQVAPGNLQTGSAQDSNLQTVIGGTSLFSNPQANAIITVPSSSGSNVESLLASEADNQTHSSKTITSAQSNAFIGVVALILLIGAFFIIRKFTSD